MTNHSTLEFNKKILLINQLKQNAAFWSYQLSDQDSNIPDAILIEQTLLHGDVLDLIALFDIFTLSDIKAVWEEKVVPHERNRRLNHYLGIFFFRIPDITNYLNKRIIERPRLERFRLLTSQD